MILKTGLAVAIMMMTTVSINAYTGNGRNHGNQTTIEKSCLTQIEGLSSDQTSKITSLEQSHQATMTELRNERRSTTDVKLKEDVRAKMLVERNNHRSQVNNLLTPEQQKTYALLHDTPNHKNQKSNAGNGHGNGNHDGHGARSKGNNSNIGHGNGHGNHSGSNCRH